MDKEIIIESVILKITNDILDLCDEDICELKQNIDMPLAERKERLNKISVMRDIVEYILSKDYAGRHRS